MLETVGRRELKELVTEASRALARLDAERLEELANSCRLLNAPPKPDGAIDGQALAHQARDAAAEMAIFGHVLQATQANLSVMRRLRELRTGRLEYGERAVAAECAWTSAEGARGND